MHVTDKHGLAIHFKTLAIAFQESMKCEQRDHECYISGDL